MRNLDSDSAILKSFLGIVTVSVVVVVVVASAVAECSAAEKWLLSQYLEEYHFLRLFLTHDSKCVRYYSVLGYNPVITIPVGATNINVTEIRRSKNYLGESCSVLSPTEPLSPNFTDVFCRP